jgi:hypothetical protein
MRMATSVARNPPDHSTGAGAFQSGDHLRVRRAWHGIPYTHHGVWVDGPPGDEIVQFGDGEGGRKPEGVGYASLEGFERGARAELVPHGRYEGIHWLPHADPPERVVERARWLAEHAAELPPQPYNLIGHNCEHVANWCVCGYTESHQYKRALLAVAYAKAGFYLYITWRIRQGTMTPALWAALLPNLVSTWTIHVYNREIKRFWQRVREAP